MSCAANTSTPQHPGVRVGPGANSGFKISISGLTRGSCECEAKNKLLLRWGGSSRRSNTIQRQRNPPNKSAAGTVFTVWARFCLDPHLCFPTAPAPACEPGQPSARCTIWQRVSFQIQYEELQSRNPHFSKNNRRTNGSCCRGCSLVRRCLRMIEAERYPYSRISTDPGPDMNAATLNMTSSFNTMQH